MKKFVREFDLFSKPFKFFVGDKKNKTTFVGGFLSLTILGVSIAYFYYLINMYFSNKIEPKITTSISIENDSISIDINDNFFIFELLISGGEPLNLYEKRVGKKYLTYSVVYEQYGLGGTYSGLELPVVECADPKFQGFLCVDTAAIKGNNIYMQPINKVSSNFSLAVHYCDDQKISNCATPEEIYSTILQSYNYFQVYTKIRQYSPSSRQYNDGYKSEYLYFDPNQLVFTRIVLIKATTTVTEGMLIQTSESSEDIFDFKRIDTYFSKENIYERMGIDGFAYISFEINQVRNIIVVQHAMITEVLAQFMSIFNSLLTIGILARLLAESHIVEDMNSILLKEYYKKTALKLVQKKEKKEILSNTTTVQKLDEKNNNKLTSISLDESHAIASLQKKIKETNFIEQSKKFFEMSYFERFKIFMHQITGKHPEVNLNDQGSDSKIFQHLLNQSVKRINIFEVYKDLIKLKMFIKLMLTKEQYAAMQFCGSDILEDNQIPSKEKNKNKLNNELEQSNFFEFKSNIVSPTGCDIQLSPIFSTQRMNLLPSIQQYNNDTIQSNNNIIKMIFSKDEFNLKLDANESPTNQKKQQTNIDKDTLQQPIPFIKTEENTTNNYLQDQFEDLNKKKEKITQNDYQSNKMFLQPSKQINIDLDKQFQIKKNNGDTIELEQLYEQSSSLSSSQDDSEGKQKQVIQKRKRKDNKKSGCIEQNLAETQKRINLTEEQEQYFKYCLSDDVTIKQQQLNIHHKEADFSTKQILSKDQFHSVKSHLQEMDFIEESDELQEQLLKKFLENINSNFQECQDITKLNHIDRHIFQSLLIEKGYK